MLFWQMGGLGPMLGQNHHFSGYAPEKITYAIERYRKETERLYGVLDDRLADRELSPAGIRLPISLLFRGSCRTKDRNKTWMTFLMSRDGLRLLGAEPPYSGPTTSPRQLTQQPG